MSLRLFKKALCNMRTGAAFFSIALIFGGEAVFSPSASAQKKTEGILEFNQVPATGVSLPKARLHSVKIDPSNSFNLFSATAEGLQVSENGGLSWRKLAVSGKDEEVFALEVDPLRPNLLFVGRRDGLWRSKDGGRSWDALPYPDSVPVALSIAKKQPNTLYLATSRHGLYKSTDGGYQWKEINKNIPKARAGGRPEEIRMLLVDPLDPNTVYASLERLGIYHTVDGGENWQPFNQGLPFPFMRPIHPPRLAYDPSDPKKLYLAFNQPIHSQLLKTRLYVLSDNNDRWLPVNARIPDNFPVRDLVVDSAKNTIQIWGAEAVLEASLPGKSGTK